MEAVAKRTKAIINHKYIMHYIVGAIFMVILILSALSIGEKITCKPENESTNPADPCYSLKKPTTATQSYTTWHQGLDPRRVQLESKNFRVPFTTNPDKKDAIVVEYIKNLGLKSKPEGEVISKSEIAFKPKNGGRVNDYQSETDVDFKREKKVDNQSETELSVQPAYNIGLNTTIKFNITEKNDCDMEKENNCKTKNETIFKPQNDTGFKTNN